MTEITAAERSKVSSFALYHMMYAPVFSLHENYSLATRIAQEMTDEDLIKVRGHLSLCMMLSHENQPHALTLKNFSGWVQKELMRRDQREKEKKVR